MNIPPHIFYKACYIIYIHNVNAEIILKNSSEKKEIEIRFKAWKFSLENVNIPQKKDFIIHLRSLHKTF